MHNELVKRISIGFCILKIIKGYGEPSIELTQKLTIFFARYVEKCREHGEKSFPNIIFFSLLVWIWVWIYLTRYFRKEKFVCVLKCLYFQCKQLVRLN